MPVVLRTPLRAVLAVAVVAAVLVSAGSVAAATAPAHATARRTHHHRGAVRHRHRAKRHAVHSRKRPPAPPPTGTGYDISYPQCGHAYPSGQSFGVVGVNGGLANNANACRASELNWSASSPGLTSPPQPPASLYLNTADPGNGVGDWPSPARGTGGGATPYGACDGSWSQACAYVYGEQRSAYSYSLVATAATAVNPATAPSWLDVETTNSWATAASNPQWPALNVATLQGFVAGVRNSGATGSVGFYSTASQWQSITGQTAQTSPTYFPTTEPDWVAGAGSAAQAQANCSASFTGGRVALAQFPASGFDGDLACA